MEIISRLVIGWSAEFSVSHVSVSISVSESHGGAAEKILKSAMCISHGREDARCDMYIVVYWTLYAYQTFTAQHNTTQYSTEGFISHLRAARR